MEESTIENNILVDLNPTMLILVLNTNGQNFPIKVRDYQDGLKKQDFFHKRWILNIKTQIENKWIEGDIPCKQ